MTMGRQGRLVVPAAVRRALGWHAGDTFVLRTTDRGLLLEPVADPVAQLRSIAAAVPRSRSLVAELLAERRSEAVDR